MLETKLEKSMSRTLSIALLFYVHVLRCSSSMTKAICILFSFVDRVHAPTAKDNRMKTCCVAGEFHSLLADITRSSTEEYNRHLTNLIYLTPEQIHVIKDIRRRGKNKVGRDINSRTEGDMVRSRLRHKIVGNAKPPVSNRCSTKLTNWNVSNRNWKRKSDPFRNR